MLTNDHHFFREAQYTYLRLTNLSICRMDYARHMHLTFLLLKFICNNSIFVITYKKIVFQKMMVQDQFIPNKESVPYIISTWYAMTFLMSAVVCTHLDLVQRKIISLSKDVLRFSTPVNSIFTAQQWKVHALHASIIFITVVNMTEDIKKTIENVSYPRL